MTTLVCKEARESEGMAPQKILKAPQMMIAPNIH